MSPRGFCTRLEILSQFKNFQNRSFAPSADTLNHPAIPGEIVVDYPVDSTDNRAKRRLELERLKQDLADELITEEEYDREKQKIFAKYPL